MMDAKEYLESIMKNQKIIENKLQELEQFRTMATSTTIQTDKEAVKSSGSKDKLADAVCRILETEMEIEESIEHLLAIRKEVIDTIEMLPVLEYDILHKKYVQGMNFNDIAKANNQTITWTKKQMKKALEELQAILNER